MSSNIFDNDTNGSKSIEKTLRQTESSQSHPLPKNSNSSTILACETPPPLDFDDNSSYRSEYSSPIPPNTVREKNIRDHLMIISENLLEIQESLKEITKITGIEL